jgi:hypothetical protein
MSVSRVGTARNGLSILLEMATDPRPISRTALKERCGLGFAGLDEALQLLSQAGLVSRQDGPHGRFCLASDPKDIPIRVLDEAANGRGDGRVLPDIDRNATLADITAAADARQSEICAYYEACVTLGGPGGPGTADHCRRECIE